MKIPRLANKTIQQIKQIYRVLDYKGLGPIYCDEGGEAFWEDRREPCQKLGSIIAKALKARLPHNGTEFIRRWRSPGDSTSTHGTARIESYRLSL